MFKKKILINLNCLRVVEIQNTFEYEGNYLYLLIIKNFFKQYLYNMIKY